jgi:hypothetical protein
MKISFAMLSRSVVNGYDGSYSFSFSCRNTHQRLRQVCHRSGGRQDGVGLLSSSCLGWKMQCHCANGQRASALISKSAVINTTLILLF